MDPVTSMNPQESASCEDGEDGRQSAGVRPWRGWLQRSLAAAKGFMSGCAHGAGYAVMQKEGEDQNDEFLLLCFGESLGLPLPTSYLTLDLLPHLASELEGWERRMVQRRSVLSEKAGQYSFCC